MNFNHSLWRCVGGDVLKFDNGDVIECNEQFVIMEPFHLRTDAQWWYNSSLEESKVENRIVIMDEYGRLGTVFNEYELHSYAVPVGYRWNGRTYF